VKEKRIGGREEGGRTVRKRLRELFSSMESGCKCVREGKKKRRK
jgi:hypothetical protein